ncbi:hypothetical protein BpOF4_16635 [Alkalihalophilus pseudofirmus OF4]|uniref:DUF4083 domain-containing protein n=1 Tax=Alkalihalophilus pseudofirmus (strain ATCC BAA-2126 / JCM 17055 / OF4) TaxID=398511 RepID=D3FQK0_ALKPO|nr:hypothetical protein BpOF4_16635 [Alkalihalophilus pseudofirmus OF4]
MLDFFFSNLFYIVLIIIVLLFIRINSSYSKRRAKVNEDMKQLQQRVNELERKQDSPYKEK